MFRFGRMVLQRLERFDRVRRWHVAAAINRSPHPWVIVYSFGKSGSGAIAATAKAAGFTAHHVHNLTPNGIETSMRSYRSDGVVPSGHVWISEHLIRRHPPTPERPWRVITPIRDPIARDVSAHFQTARRRGVTDHPEPDLLIQDSTVAWLDNELRSALGIDVYATPFDPSQGWQTYSSPGVELLVIRQESLDPEVLSDFLGVPIPEIAQENVSADKTYGDEYRTYLSDARLSVEVVDRVYGSRFARHFYSPEELAGLRAKWTGVPV